MSFRHSRSLPPRGGAQLEGRLATRTMDAFGDIIYNLYGSTECAYATIAAPEDLRAAPGCAGKPPFGTTVRLFDDTGIEVSPGQVGRIFVANTSQFGGYTGGRSQRTHQRHDVDRRRGPFR